MQHFSSTLSITWISLCLGHYQLFDFSHPPFLCLISWLSSHRCWCCFGQPTGGWLKANVYAKTLQYTCVHKLFLLPKGLFACEKREKGLTLTSLPKYLASAGTRLGQPPHKAANFHCQLTNSLFQGLLMREISETI